MAAALLALFVFVLAFTMIGLSEIFDDGLDKDINKFIDEIEWWNEINKPPNFILDLKVWNEAKKEVDNLDNKE